MESDDMICDILTVWLEIQEEREVGIPWLATWLLHESCREDEAARILNVVVNSKKELQARFLNRLVKTFEYAVALDFFSPQLAYQLFLLAKGFHHPNLSLPIMQLRDQAKNASWSGRSLFALSHEALAACTGGQPMALAGVSCFSRPRRSCV